MCEKFAIREAPGRPMSRPRFRSSAPCSTTSMPSNQTGESIPRSGGVFPAVLMRRVAEQQGRVFLPRRTERRWVGRCLSSTELHLCGRGAADPRLHRRTVRRRTGAGAWHRPGADCGLRSGGPQTRPQADDDWCRTCQSARRIRVWGAQAMRPTQCNSGNSSERAGWSARRQGLSFGHGARSRSRSRSVDP